MQDQGESKVQNQTEATVQDSTEKHLFKPHLFLQIDQDKGEHLLTIVIPTGKQKYEHNKPTLGSIRDAHVQSNRNLTKPERELPLTIILSNPQTASEDQYIMINCSCPSD